MKKFISIILIFALLMVIRIIPLNVFATDTVVEITATYDWYSVDAEVYEIDSVEDLVGLAKITRGNVVDENGTTINKTNFENKTVKLENDIIFGDDVYLYYQNSDSTKIIDYKIGTFAGTFDGQEHKIKNLRFYNGDITKDAKMYLFESITAEGSIKNITLDTIETNINGNDQFGFLARTLTGTADNCHIKNVLVNVVVNNGNKAYLSTTGVMFGSVSSASITNCSVIDVEINAPEGTDTSDNLGAFIGTSGGTTEKPTIISNCKIKDIVFNLARKTKRTGGFIGSTNYTTIKDCIAENLSITIGTYFQNVGGFIGTVGTGSAFERCGVERYTLDANTTDYSGYAGGFTTSVSGEKISFKDCYVKDLDMDLELSYEDFGYIGGFASNVGSSSTITFENCSVTGTIDAVDEGSNIPIGGFFGYTSNSNLTVDKCVTNLDITTPYTVGGFVGVSTAGTFKNCEVNGNLTGNISGGFIGEIVPSANNSTLAVYSSETNANIKGEEVAAGFIGKTTTTKENSTDSVIVKIGSCNSTGDIQVTNENGEKIDFMKENIPEGSTSNIQISGNSSKFSGNIALSYEGELLTGENVYILINATDEDTFAKSELELAYSNNLEFNQSASVLNGATVEIVNGNIKLTYNGDSKPYGNAIFKIAFKATSAGISTVTLNSAKFAKINDGVFQVADCSNILTAFQIKNKVVQVYTNPVNNNETSIEYTVKFQTYSETIIEEIKVKEGELISKPLNPFKEGKEFSGWYKDILCTESWDFEKDTVKKDMTLYAKWTSIQEDEPEEDIYDNEEDIEETEEKEEIEEGFNYLWIIIGLVIVTIIPVTVILFKKSKTE